MAPLRLKPTCACDTANLKFKRKKREKEVEKGKKIQTEENCPISPEGLLKKGISARFWRLLSEIVGKALLWIPVPWYASRKMPLNSCLCPFVPPSVRLFIAPLLFLQPCLVLENSSDLLLSWPTHLVGQSRPGRGQG